MSDDALDPFCVSVIIPARNAGTTLATTLDSLLVQSHGSWHAHVIDDGSTDDTAQIVRTYAARDPRISLLSGPARGVGAARNVGLAAAAAPWVLFLDSDDTIAPEMLTKMVAALRANPTADAVHCGWILTDLDGAPFGSRRCESTSPDLFRDFANYCAFCIHACVVRRAQLEQIGGFDETLRVSEDLDLWQRVARIGTRFIGIPDFLSVYRLRPKATWFQPQIFLDDVLRVARRSHAHDPRLPDALVPARHRNGAPASELAAVEAKMMTWAGAMAIARDEDPIPLLDYISYPSDGLDPKTISDILFEALPLALCQPAGSWLELLSEFGPQITRFLDAVERRSGLFSLALRTQRSLEARIAAEVLATGSVDRNPVTIGRTAALVVEVTTPINDILLQNADRAVCAVRVQGRILGQLTLPVSDDVLPALVIADAIAGRFAWPLLEAFFVQQDIYAQVSVKHDDAGWTVHRGAVLLARFAEDPSANLHDRVGWTILLQELFSQPDRTSHDFYGNDSLEPEPPQRTAEPESVVELTQSIPEILASPGETITVRGTIGGAPVAIARVPTREGIAREADIRLALLERSRMELARTAVREAILGLPLEDPRTLNHRLRAAAALRSGGYVRSLVGASAGTVVVLGSARSVRTEEIARRLGLPAASASLVIEAASKVQPVLRFGQGPVSQLLVLPELLASPQEGPTSEHAIVSGEDFGGLYGRHHFESLFASAANPWQYTSRYEQTKYDQTLAMLPAGHRSSVLEIGCAEGHFTVQLLPLVQSLVVADISEIALRRTAERCAAFSNISFRQIDLANDPIQGRFDLIVCSEMLYYMQDRAGLARAGKKLAAALKPGGYLISAHANLVVDDPHAPGFDWEMAYGAKVIGETLASVGDLEFDKELQTPLYRIQRFRRPRLPALLRRSNSTVPSPRTVEVARHATPEPEVAKHILGSGGVVTEAENAVTTSHLPILMYHHVADTGPERLARWRVTPAMFAAQMHYLKQVGFKSTTLEEWQQARREGKPLLGRRVLITFDDGYADFESKVLPALRANGFPAVMFLPSDHVGGRAVWDEVNGPPLQLMDWDAVRRLRDAGIVIGSHSRSHPYLTTLSIQDLVEELCGARLAIQREIGVSADAIAYPFGDVDETVARVAAACGYLHGLTTRDSMSGLEEDGLSLSRIEVMGLQTLEQFIARLA